MKVGLTVGLSLGAIVGLVGCGEEADGVSGSDLAAVVSGNGLSANGLSANGLSGNGLSGNGLSGNGLTKTNGLSGNGLSGNGLSANGLSVQNGLSGNGLLTTSGFMTTDMGRKVVAYLAKCALASNDSFTKQDQYGTSYTFPGSLGLCPAWKDGGIATDRGCMNRISACIMAHVNTAGVHIPIWIDSEYSSVGWGVDLVNYPFQEGTFFGNIFATGNLSSIGMSGITGPAAYFCDGNGFAGGNAGVVAGRLGKGSANAPYVNPFGDGVLCNNKGTGQFTNGVGGQPGPDGFKQICANGYCFQAGEPITVWRATTYTPVFDDQYIYRLSPMSATGSSLDVANSFDDERDRRAAVLDLGRRPAAVLRPQGQQRPLCHPAAAQHQQVRRAGRQWHGERHLHGGPGLQQQQQPGVDRHGQRDERRVHVQERRLR